MLTHFQGKIKQEKILLKHHNITEYHVFHKYRIPIYSLPCVNIANYNGIFGEKMAVLTFRRAQTPLPGFFPFTVRKNGTVVLALCSYNIL